MLLATISLAFIGSIILWTALKDPTGGFRRFCRVWIARPLYSIEPSDTKGWHKVGRAVLATAFFLGAAYLAKNNLF